MIKLQRRFDPDAIAVWRLLPPGSPPPAPTHVDVQELRGERQNFSHRFVNAGVAEGWLTLGRGS